MEPVTCDRNGTLDDDTVNDFPDVVIVYELIPSRVDIAVTPVG